MPRKTAKPAAKIGRPSTFTPALGLAICGRLAEGESLRRICDSKGMPDKATILRWLSAGIAPDAPGELREFRDQYARARELQADALFDECQDIADDGRRDYTIGKGGIVVDHDHIARSRLRVDTRKWMAGKLNPKKYGDKITAEHDVADPLRALFDQICGRAIRPAEPALSPETPAMSAVRPK
jgi:hypothetical protein